LLLLAYDIAIAIATAKTRRDCDVVMGWKQAGEEEVTWVMSQSYLLSYN
jgi:hypothetical protein